MPSTVYKGDLAEVSFAPETGLVVRVGPATDGSSDVGLTVVAAADNITELTFKAEVNNVLFGNGTHKLNYPKNILVGSQLVWTDAHADQNADDVLLADLGRIFTIVENDGITLKIAPEMFTPAITTMGDGNVFQILPYKTPPMDVGMTHTTAGESVKTDQFLGIATALTLPETKVDLKRFHVVGLGRDAAVQVPGKLINEGGSFEVAMHSARWLKYCLGNELINSSASGSLGTQLRVASVVGQSHLDLDETTISGVAIAVGDYLEIRDEALVGDVTVAPIVSDHEPDGGTWTGALTDFEFDNAKPHEVRRVIAVSEHASDFRVYLDEPLSYPHAVDTDVELRDPGTTASLPVIVTSTGTITNPVTRLLYSRSTMPSFSLEVSQRRRDIDSHDSTTDGGVGDSKELTRVFRGCKVTDWTMTTDNDAALRLSVNFNAALCYTDTGRLDAGGVTRYSAHRMFDDTANTEQGRIESGIAKGTQKPFMFYNGSINLAGQQVAQVMSMTLTGQTGMQSFHTINGNNQASSVYADQVPFGGARNASLMVEGQTTYEMTMEIAVDDPLFYHKMRTGTEFSVNSEDSTVDGFPRNQIRIEFEKNLTGSTAAGASEKMILLIDDYYIVEAPLQIPEDKGVVKSTIKIMPKAVKVLARDAIPKY